MTTISLSKQKNHPKVRDQSTEEIMHFANLCLFIHSVSLCAVCDRSVCKYIATGPLGHWTTEPGPGNYYD